MRFLRGILIPLFILSAIHFVEPSDSHPELILQTGHTGSILAVAISPDGRWLVSGGQDSTLKIWDLKTGNLLRTLYGHNGKIVGLAISADSHFIASAADDGTARLWDVSGGQQMRDLSGHTNIITSVAFANGGQQVLTASTDAIKIWETASGKQLRSIAISEKDQGGRITLSQDGRLYTLGGANQAPDTGFLSQFKGGGDVVRPLRVIEIASGRELMSLKTDPLAPFAIYVISPDGRFLARRASDRNDQNKDSVRVYDISSGKEIANLRIPGEGSTQGMGAAAFSSGGKWIAAQGAMDESMTQSIVIFDLATKQKVRELKTSGMFAPAISLEVATIMTNPFAFSPDARILAYGGSSSIQLWDANTGELMHKLRTHLKAGAATISPMDNLMAEEAAKHGYTLEQAVEMKQEAGGLMDTLSDPDNPLSGIMSMGAKMSGLQGGDARSYSDKRIQFSPNGRWLISESRDEIRIWDIASGSLQQQKTYMRVPIAFSRDGRLLALMEFDPIKGSTQTSIDQRTQDLVIRDLNTWSVLNRTTFTGKVQPQELTFAPDSSWLAVKISNEVRILDSKNGNQLRTIPVGQGFSDKYVFDTSGHYLAMAGKPASASSNPFDQLTSMLTGAQKMDPKNMKEMQKMQKEMMKTLGQQSKGGSPPQTPYTIKIIDLQNGSEIQTLPLESQPQQPAQFGDVIVPGSDTETHQIIFSADGSLIAIETTDQQYPAVKIFETATARALATIRISNKLNQTTDSNPMSRMFQKHLRPVFVFSPDHSKIAISSQESGYSVKLYNTANGSLISTLPQNNRVDAIAFHPTGKFLVTIIRDGSRTVWDLSNGTLRATLMEFPGLYFSTEWLVATPDGLFDGSPAAWGQIQWRLSNNIFDLSPVETFFNEFYYPGLLSEIFSAKPPVAPRNLSQLDRRQPQIQMQSDGKGDTRDVKIRIDVKESAADAQHTSGSGVRDVRLFRNGVLVKVWRGDVLQGQSAKALEAQIPIVAGDNRFVAYAFNHDNVKSQDSLWRVRGADSLKRKGIAYIVAIGINQYENANFNLKYAVADAQAFAESLASAQTHLAQFEKVQVVSLFDQQATKAGIVALLKAFAEHGDPEKNIQPVQPEDALFVYFAGHGTAEKSHFYMVPHDLGYSGPRDEMADASYQEVLKHAISDEELEQLLENVAAGQTLLVIDACNSGQALESEEKRRGPMNSKGLAQLAYEKGMYVLAAAQGYQAALEAARLGHGYLTYALVEEGMKTSSADQQPKDGEVVVREWLDFAAGRVPEMQSEKMQEARLLKHEVAFVDGEEIIQDLQQRSVQQPRVFYRRESDLNPLIILKP